MTSQGGGNGPTSLPQIGDGQTSLVQAGDGQTSLTKNPKSLAQMGIKDWEADVWSYVQEDVDRLRKLNPLRLDDPGWLAALKLASANLASESGVTRAMPWNLAWVNPLAEAIPNDEVTFARALKTGRYHFTVAGKWQAPVAWPLERQIDRKSVV